MEPAVRDMLLQNQLRINRKKFAECWIYRKSTVFLCDFIYCWFDFMLICFLEVGYWYQFQLFSRSTSQICNICTHFVTLHWKKRNAGGWFDYVTDSLMPCFYQNYSVKICWFSSSDCRYSDKDEHKLYFERSKSESQRREEVRAC